MTTMTTMNVQDVKRGLRLTKVTLRRLDLSAMTNQPQPQTGCPAQDRGASQNSCSKDNRAPGPGQDQTRHGPPPTPSSHCPPPPKP